jgi:hypothetical protein
MDTASIGNGTEAAVLNAFIARGYGVFLPFGEGHPYDLVVSVGPVAFLRVQCKTARRRGGCLQFNSRTTDHGRGRLKYDGLADLFGVHFPEDGSVYLVPVAEASTFVFNLRTQPTLNNQRRGVRFASDYAVDRWSPDSLAALIGSAAGPARAESLQLVR